MGSEGEGGGRGDAKIWTSSIICWKICFFLPQQDVIEYDFSCSHYADCFCCWIFFVFRDSFVFLSIFSIRLKFFWYCLFSINADWVRRKTEMELNVKNDWKMFQMNRKRIGKCFKIYCFWRHLQFWQPTIGKTLIDFFSYRISKMILYCNR